MQTLKTFILKIKTINIRRGLWQGHLQESGVYGRIILKLISRNKIGVFTGLIWLRIGTSAGSCQHANEPLSFIKCVEFLGDPEK